MTHQQDGVVVQAAKWTAAQLSPPHCGIKGLAGSGERQRDCRLRIYPAVATSKPHVPRAEAVNRLTESVQRSSGVHWAPTLAIASSQLSRTLATAEVLKQPAMLSTGVANPVKFLRIRWSAGPHDSVPRTGKVSVVNET